MYSTRMLVLQVLEECGCTCACVCRHQSDREGNEGGGSWDGEEVLVASAGAGHQAARQPCGQWPASVLPSLLSPPFFTSRFCSSFFPSVSLFYLMQVFLCLFLYLCLSVLLQSYSFFLSFFVSLSLCPYFFNLIFSFFLSSFTSFFHYVLCNFCLPLLLSFITCFVTSVFLHFFFFLSSYVYFLFSLPVYLFTFFLSVFLLSVFDFLQLPFFCCCFTMCGLTATSWGNPMEGVGDCFHC